MSTECENPTSMRAVLALDGRCVVVNTALPTTGEGYILIRVRASGINRLDTSQRRGIAKPPPGAGDVLGLEVAGEVVAVGSSVQGFQIGERVMALVSAGGYAEFVAARASECMRIPPLLSWVQAAGVPEAFLTAFQLLHLVGRVSQGETVLVHAAASGVGVAAIQLAVAAGARVLATVGSQEKLDFCLSLGCSGGAVRHDGPWHKALIAAGLVPEGGGGVDLVLDCVGRDFADANIEVLNTDARWVLYSLLSGGALDDVTAAKLFPKLMAKRATIAATTLRARPAAYKADLVARFSESALPALASGAVKVLVDRAFGGGLEDAQAAHDLMESNSTMGKVVLVVAE